MRVWAVYRPNPIWARTPAPVDRWPETQKQRHNKKVAFVHGTLTKRLGRIKPKTRAMIAPAPDPIHFPNPKKNRSVAKLVTGCEAREGQPGRPRLRRQVQSLVAAATSEPKAGPLSMAALQERR
jgi:hypothetical protein